jgi:hypothetical protein
VKRPARIIGPLPYAEFMAAVAARDLEERSVKALERLAGTVPAHTGRPPGRVVSLGRIARAYLELSLVSEKRPSQADVAKKLRESLRNVERALADAPEFWDELTHPA